jgi:RecB family exonuclease
VLADQAAWRVSAGIAAASPGVSRMSAPDRGAFPRVAASSLRGTLRVSASAVDEWYECPYLYWFLRVARVESPPDEIEMLSSLARGSIAHSVWQEVWTRYSRGDGATLAAILREGWDDLMASNVRRYPFLADGRASAARADLRRTMLGMAELQDGIESRAASAGLARARTELEYRLPELETEHAVFVGFADRVDIWKGVGAVIVDYKIGSLTNSKDGLQLACYAAMLRAADAEDIAGFCYMGHRDGDVRGAWVRDDLKDVYGDRSKKAPGLDERVSAAVSVMRDMDAVLGGGKYAANYDSKRCDRCVCAKVCRRTERFGAFAAADGEESDDGGDE